MLFRFLDPGIPVDTTLACDAPVRTVVRPYCCTAVPLVLPILMRTTWLDIVLED